MKVLLIVIDAASPRVVCPAVQVGTLPNMRRLAEAGEMHQSSVTIFPSITPAATTSIITGCYPSESGIVGASWFDEATREVAYYGDDFWIIARHGFGAFLRDFLIRLNGDRLKAPTMFEMVEQQGRSAASLNYLIHRGLVQHKVNVPWLLAILPGVPLTETVSGPSTLCLGDFVTGYPLEHKPRRERGVQHRFGMDDAATTELLVELAAARKLPDFTVAYFADNDYRSHEVGPHKSLPVVEAVDRSIGAMFDASGGIDRFLEEYMVLITSDHGHSEILGDKDAASIDLANVLADFRQVTPGKKWHDGDELMICPNMRAVQVYVPQHELIERVARTCLLEPRVDVVMWKRDDETHGTTYTAMGPRGRLEFWWDGRTWAWQGDGETLGLVKDGGRTDSEEYPNPFERIAGALDASGSGEIWVTAQPGCEFAVPGEDVHVGGGSHGALHALDSLSPVIVAGAPRRLPANMRAVDIAPLCMEALGLEMRYRVGDPRVSERGARALPRRAT